MFLILAFLQTVPLSSTKFCSNTQRMEYDRQELIRHPFVKVLAIQMGKENNCLSRCSDQTWNALFSWPFSLIVWLQSLWQQVNMFVELLLFTVFQYGVQVEDCLKCICLQESECKPIGCHMDVGSLSCGYYQIKLPYYKDCGTPGRKSGEDVTTAWKRCADDYNCATQCVKAYANRYKKLCASIGQESCQAMARLHNGGPSGCSKSATIKYWEAIKKCCECY